MKSEIRLPYGANPHQLCARICASEGVLPFRVLKGRPTYNNLADALHAWALANELSEFADRPAAVSVKYGNPIGASLVSTDDRATDSNDLERPTLLACAASRARSTSPLAAIHDWIALSDLVESNTAEALLAHSADGIIAPGFTATALDCLEKAGDHLRILEIDVKAFSALNANTRIEARMLYGLCFEQERRSLRIFQNFPLSVANQNTTITLDVRRDLLFGMIINKYTSARAVSICKQGYTVAISAGEQSEAEAVRRAAAGADCWRTRKYPVFRSLGRDLEQSEREEALHWFFAEDAGSIRSELWRNRLPELREAMALDSISEQRERNGALVMCSSVSLRRRESLQRAKESGVGFLLQPEVPSSQFVDDCEELGIVLATSGVRLISR